MKQTEEEIKKVSATEAYATKHRLVTDGHTDGQRNRYTMTANTGAS